MGDLSFQAMLDVPADWVAAGGIGRAFAIVLAAFIVAVVPALVVVLNTGHTEAQPDESELNLAGVTGLIVGGLTLLLFFARGFAVRFFLAPYVVALTLWWLLAAIAFALKASSCLGARRGWVFLLAAFLLGTAAGVVGHVARDADGTFGARWAAELALWPAFMLAVLLPLFLLLSLREPPKRYYGGSDAFPVAATLALGVGLPFGLTVLAALGVPRTALLATPLIIGLSVLRAFQLAASLPSRGDSLRALVAKTKADGLYRRRTLQDRAAALRFISDRPVPPTVWAELIGAADTDDGRSTLLAELLPALERQRSAAGAVAGSELVTDRLLALRGRADPLALASTLRAWGRQADAFELLGDTFLKSNDTKALDRLVSAGDAARAPLLHIARTLGHEEGRLKAAQALRWGLSADELGDLACLSPKGAMTALSALLSQGQRRRDILQAVAKEAKRPDVRIAAARELPDRDILVELACSKLSEAVTAFRELQQTGCADHEALITVAIKGHHKNLRLEAARMANSRDALVALACEDSDTAIQALSDLQGDAAALAMIARNARRLDVRLGAAKTGHDLEALVALASEDTKITADAFAALRAMAGTDLAPVAKVAAQAANHTIRFQASMAVGDAAGLAAVARNTAGVNAQLHEKALDALLALGAHGQGAAQARASKELRLLAGDSKGPTLNRIVAALTDADLDAAFPQIMRGKTGSDAWGLLETRERRRGSGLAVELAALSKEPNRLKDKIVAFVEANPDLAGWIAQTLFPSYSNRPVLDECIKRPGRGTGLFLLGYLSHLVDFERTKPKRAPYPALAPSVDHILPELERAMTSGTSQVKKLSIKTLICASRQASPAAEGDLRHKLEFKRTRSLGRTRTAYDEVLKRWKDPRVAAHLADLDERKHSKWSWR